MRLSDRDIIAALEHCILHIDPEPDYGAISGVSVDLHLSNRFRTFNAYAMGHIDCGDFSQAMLDLMSAEIEADPFYLHPGELVIACTHERIGMPDDLVGWLDGRSSLARLGLMVHVTAHRIDPGWDGQIVLECFNAGKLPLALRPGMAIGAISFERMTSPALWPYRSRYRGQCGPVGSRLHACTEKPLPADSQPAPSVLQPPISYG